MKNILMVIHMKVILITVRLTEKVLMSGQHRMKFTLVNGYKVLDMAKVSGNQKLVNIMKANGKWVNQLALAYLNGRMGIFMKDSGRMV